MPDPDPLNLAERALAAARAMLDDADAPLVDRYVFDQRTGRMRYIDPNGVITDPETGLAWRMQGPPDG